MAQGTTKGVPIDVDPLLDLDSDLVVPSQKAIKAYVDAKKSAADNDYVSVSGDNMTGFLTLNADPTINLHAATKQYVDNYINGLDYKKAANAGTVNALPTCIAATLTLTGSVNGAITSSITDGYTLLTGNRVLVKNQVATANNGIYVVTRTGDASTTFLLTRADDANTGAELGEATLSIINGSTLANTIWHCTPDSPTIVLGTTGLTFIQVGSGSIGTGTLNQLAYWSSTTALGSTGNITTTKQFLSQTGDGTISSAPAWGALTKTDVGLSNVENTALSTWTGSTNIVTLGTISSGTWNGTTIAVANGGTAITSYTVGDMLYADTGNVLLKLSMPMNQNSVLVAGTTPSWSSTPSLDSLTLRSTGSLTLGLSGPGGNTGQIILRNSANTNTLTLQSGASSSSYTLTLPVAAPGANQYLQFTSGGVASWVNGTVVGVTTVGAFSGSAQTNGASISGSTITFGPASATVPGMVSTGTQTFAGAKTLSSGLTISATTNQLVLGTTNTTTITSTAPAASRVYTIPDAGTTASFIMTEGAQNIVGAKTFTGSAGPLIFSQTGAGTFTAPAVGATPSAGTRIVIAPGDASNFANGIGWNTSYEFWLSSRQNITFYPNNSASRVAEFTSITGTSINTTGVKGINFINGFSAFDPVLNAGAGWIKFINWNDNSGNGAPSLTARSAGTRIVLVASANGSTVSDTAIGNVQEGGGGTNYTSMWFMAAREIFFHTNSSATEIFRINSTGLSYKGTQVVSSRITAWGTPGGTLTRATIAPDVAATPTAAQFNALAQNVRALITDLRSHGLIGT